MDARLGVAGLANEADDQGDRVESASLITTCVIWA
jgi:hypothetical protein